MEERLVAIASKNTGEVMEVLKGNVMDVAQHIINTYKPSSVLAKGVRTATALMLGRGVVFDVGDDGLSAYTIPDVASNSERCIVYSLTKGVSWGDCNDEHFHEMTPGAMRVGGVLMQLLFPSDNVWYRLVFTKKLTITEVPKSYWAPLPLYQTDFDDDTKAFSNPKYLGETDPEAFAKHLSGVSPEDVLTHEGITSAVAHGAYAFANVSGGIGYIMGDIENARKHDGEFPLEFGIPVLPEPYHLKR